MKKLGDESGQTLVMVALSMTVLLGFAAFATDVGIMLHEKREVQSAADSAAIAAATAISQHNGDWVDAGLTDAALNGFTVSQNCASGSTVEVCITAPPANGYFSAKMTGYVEAVITQQVPTFFMRLFGKDAMTVGSRAVATYLGTSDACGFVPNPTNNNPAGNPWGNSSITSNCGWEFNGNLALGASDSMLATYVGTSGTITGTKALGDTTYATGIPEFTDPLSYLQGAIPKDNGNGTCTSPVDPTNPDATLPKCFLNQPLIPDATGMIPSGVYFYDDPSKATYTGYVTGLGVTIVLTNNSLLSVSGNGGAGTSCLNLTALNTGIYSGVVLDAPTYVGELDLDFGATASIFNGTIYAPNADLSLQDQGANGSSCPGTNNVGVTINGNLVVGTLDALDRNNGNLILNSTPSGVVSPIPRISLVE